jgi:hypothetical protein
MADLSAFHSSLHAWLKDVWENRTNILVAARAAGDTKEGMYQVYDLYNAPGKVRVSDRDFDDFIAQCRAYAANNGFQCSPQNGDWVPGDFYHFERPGQSRRQQAGTVSLENRIYVHTQVPLRAHAMPVVKLLLETARGYDGIVKLKVAGPGMNPRRKDTIVIWLQHEIAVQWLLKRMKENAYTAHYDGDTPPGVKPVMAGLGYATEPPRVSATHPVFRETGMEAHSFGTYLASGIFMALRTLPKSKQNDGGAFLAWLLEIFQRIGVNPKAPHQFTLRSNEMGHMAFVANHTLVMHNRIAGDLIVNDHLLNTDPTQPFYKFRDFAAQKAPALQRAKSV